MLSKFNMTERAFKNMINLTFLSLSCFLIVYFLIQLTPNPVIKVGITLFAIILEVFMQYLLSVGRVRWRTKQCFHACVLFFFYGLYVLVYAVPSATGFFMAEIKAQEKTWAHAEIVEDTNKQRLLQIASTIKNLNAQLLTESRSGYGRHSQLIMDEIKRLTREEISIQKRFETTPQAKATITKDLFKIMSDLYKIPGNLLKLLIFSISVIMVYVGLIMTSWDLSFAGNHEEVYEQRNESIYVAQNELAFEVETPDSTEPNEIDTPNHEPEIALDPSMERDIKVNGVFEPHHQTSLTVKVGKVVCPTCGKHFPHKKESTFCCSNCRLKAYNVSVKKAAKDVAYHI